MGKIKRFIYADTIGNGVYGFDGRNHILPNSPDETKKGKIGNFNVSIRRHKYLDKYGNPLYDVYVFDNRTGKNGFPTGSSASYQVEKAIKKTGCDIRR